MLSFQLVLSSYVFLAIAALGVLISCFTDIRLLGPFIQNCDDINPLNCSCMIVLIRGLLMKTFMEQPPLLYSGPSHDAKSTMCLCAWRLPSLAALDILQLLNWGIWVLRRIFVQNKGFASLNFLWFTKRGNLKSLSNVNFWPLQSELSSILDSSYSFVTCTYQQGAT